MLLHPDFTRPFILYTDASDFALGAVLIQLVPDPQDSNREVEGAEVIFRVL